MNSGGTADSNVRRYGARYWTLYRGLKKLQKRETCRRCGRVLDPGTIAYFTSANKKYTCLRCLLEDFDREEIEHALRDRFGIGLDEALRAYNRCANLSTTVKAESESRSQEAMPVLKIYSKAEVREQIRVKGGIEAWFRDLVTTAEAFGAVICIPVFPSPLSNYLEDIIEKERYGNIMLVREESECLEVKYPHMLIVNPKTRKVHVLHYEGVDKGYSYKAKGIDLDWYIAYYLKGPATEKHEAKPAEEKRAEEKVEAKPEERLEQHTPSQAEAGVQQPESKPAVEKPAEAKAEEKAKAKAEEKAAEELGPLQPVVALTIRLDELLVRKTISTRVRSLAELETVIKREVDAAPCVYVLKCFDEVLYVGKAENCRERLLRHFIRDTPGASSLKEKIAQLFNVDLAKANKLLAALVTEIEVYVVDPSKIIEKVEEDLIQKLKPLLNEKNSPRPFRLNSNGHVP